MEELFNLGISENTIKRMIEIVPEIIDLSKEEIISKENLLKQVKCSQSQILNIISINPSLLNRTDSDIVELFKYLTKLGFRSLNILFDSNPFILDLEPFEIENYINKRLNNNEPLQDIIDDLDSNPYLFNEL